MILSEKQKAGKKYIEILRTSFLFGVVLSDEAVGQIRQTRPARSLWSAQMIIPPRMQTVDRCAMAPQQRP